MQVKLSKTVRVALAGTRTIRGMTHVSGKRRVQPMRCLKRLWRDEDGFIVSTDLLLIAVIVVLGTIVGLVSLRDQVVQEFGDLAQAIGHLNQSYRYEGTNDSDSDAQPDNPQDCFVAGSKYEDKVDAGEGPGTPGSPPFGISFSSVPDPDEDTPAVIQ
jgi:hypothetical protein